MQCNYCGTELKENAGFCTKCGKAVENDRDKISVPKRNISNADFGKDTMLKTQVSILVRKESAYSAFRWKVFGHVFLWFLYIFSKKTSNVNILIDKDSENPKYMELEPQKEPYIIDLKPGYHEIIFEDGNADSKGQAGELMRISAGIAAGGFVSGMLGSGGVDTFCNFMDATAGKTIRNGFAAFTLQKGDVYELICRPTAKGVVKLWERKK